MKDLFKALQRFMFADFDLTVVAEQATKVQDAACTWKIARQRSHVACTKKMHNKPENPRYSIAPRIPLLTTPPLGADKGRERQRKAEKGREGQRKAEKGRERQRKAEKGRAGTMANSSFTL